MWWKDLAINVPILSPLRSGLGNKYIIFYENPKEPQKPDDALGYLKKSVGGSDDTVTIETLRKENDDLKKKVKY